MHLQAMLHSSARLVQPAAPGTLLGMQHVVRKLKPSNVSPSQGGSSIIFPTRSTVEFSRPAESSLGHEAGGGMWAVACVMARAARKKEEIEVYVFDAWVWGLRSDLVVAERAIRNPVARQRTRS